MSIARLFTTTRFPRSERTRAWREHVNGSLLAAKIQPFHEAGIDVESYTRPCGEFVLSATRSNEHAIQRTPESIEAEPKGKVFISAVLGGSAVLYQPGVVHTASPGDVIIYTPDIPYMIAFQPNTSQLFAEIPLEVFNSRFGVDTPGLARKTNVGRSRSSRFSVDNVRNLAADVASHSSADAGILDSFEALLSYVSEAAFPAQRNPALLQAKKFIDENAHDPVVSPAFVAAQVHLSTRQLDRLFATEGVTISGYLARVRSEIARHLLAESASPSRDRGAQRIRLGFDPLSARAPKARGSHPYTRALNPTSPHLIPSHLIPSQIVLPLATY